jgi:hypothetical protein
MEVIMTVRHGGAITGQEIMDAVKFLTNDEYYAKKAKVIDDLVLYHVGRKSSYPYENVIIAVGENYNTLIDPIQTYDQVAVMFYEWPDEGGSFYAVGYTDDTVIESVQRFRNQLETQLS